MAQGIVSRAPAAELSIVVPLFNEAGNLRELHQRLTAALEAAGMSFEMLFVDDGSADGTVGILRELTASDPRARALILACNRGQHNALLAGFRHARGRIAVTLDADLQHPPEEIPKLVAALKPGTDIVFGVFRSRCDPFHKRLTSGLAQIVMRRALRVPGGVRFSPFRALDRHLLDRLASCATAAVQLETLICKCTDRVAAVEVSHAPRHAGRTKYTLRRRLAFAFNLAAHLGTLTFRVVVAVGLVSGALTVIAGAVLLAGLPAWSGSTAAAAFAFVVLAALGSTVLVGIGILGECLTRVEALIAGEPQYVVREYLGFGDDVTVEAGGGRTGAPLRAALRKG